MINAEFHSYLLCLSLQALVIDVSVFHYSTKLKNDRLKLISNSEKYNRLQNKCCLQRFCLPIQKLHSILVVMNLLAHNSLSQICYCGQIYYRVLQLTAVFSGN